DLEFGRDDDPRIEPTPENVPRCRKPSELASRELVPTPDANRYDPSRAGRIKRCEVRIRCRPFGHVAVY
ncbi:MAG: hypothetical protein MK364_05535, partial [Pirellulales bacterium]|nr:hypothetical protein [Pirellulales bacterium]